MWILLKRKVSLIIESDAAAWKFLNAGFLATPLGMLVAGLAFALAGGCPGRQLFMSGEGNSDAGIFVLGSLAGAGIAHNFGLASSPQGIGPYGVQAVVICLAVLLFIGFTNRK